MPNCLVSLILTINGLPSILESSFNEKAISKVNAAGADDYAAQIGEKIVALLEMSKIPDCVYLSTLAAIGILKTEY